VIDVVLLYINEDFQADMRHKLRKIEVWLLPRWFWSS